MKSPRIFQRQDWLTGGVAAVIAMTVYAYTAAPNVTLLDSGEFLTAAEHFGVPHPPGYPLWTLLSWLFTLFPLGNSSWEIAIFSGVCAALSVGICGLLASNTLLWMRFIPEEGSLRLARPCLALTFSLLLAFSVSMWSQAVIAEVYGLHAFMTSIFFLTLYRWAHQPQRNGLMLLAFFVLALSFGNHHLTLVLTPIPFILILLLRRRAFLDWLAAAIVTVLFGYYGFAVLSHDPLVMKTSIRFWYCGGLALFFFAYQRKWHVRWRLLFFLPVIVAVGLSTYLYMPFASSTNPPMNWGHTRDASGFFFSLNRSQYNGTLSEESLRTLGRFLGTYIKEIENPGPKKPYDYSAAQKAQNWIGFFWMQLAQSFTFWCLIAYFCSIFAVFRLELAQRTWIYTLHIAFVLTAFLQPLMDDASIDLSGWWLQMPYHTYTNWIFAVLCTVGTAFILSLLLKKYRRLVWLTPALLILPALTFQANLAECSQRNHWFGWMYGHDMLKDLPKGSMVFGGSDPGRFVPTYMIFGESAEPPMFKRDPAFDRRDLYILTQNALGEKNYMNYLRDQYTTARPAPKNAFERWLGREHAYPPDPIILPTENEVREMIDKLEKDDTSDAAEQENKSSFFGLVLKWIWEKNRDKHDFFVEESFPIKWTYDYAIPHGLIYQIGKTKLDKLPPDIVAADFAFWHDYKTRLLADPEFLKDYDAQHSFSKLRETIANIYRHKNMDAEAERAYLEAIELSPQNIDAILSVTKYFWDRGDFDSVIQMLDRALEHDYNNLDLAWLRVLADRRKDAEGQIHESLDKLSREPKNRDAAIQLLHLYATMEEPEKADALIERTSKDFADDAEMLRVIIDYQRQNNAPTKALAPAEHLVAIESSNTQNYVTLAEVYFSNGKKKEFYETANKAVEVGGLSIREALINNPLFEPWKNDPEFKKLESPLPLVQPASSSSGGQEQKTLRSP